MLTGDGDAKCDASQQLSETKRRSTPCGLGEAAEAQCLAPGTHGACSGAYIWNSTLTDKWTSNLKKATMLFWIFHLLQPNLIIHEIWMASGQTYTCSNMLSLLYLPFFNLPVQSLLILYALALYITPFPFSNCFHLSVAGPCCIFTCPKLRQPPEACSSRDSCPEPPGREYFPTRGDSIGCLLTENTSIACSAYAVIGSNKPTLLSTTHPNSVLLHMISFVPIITL